MREDRFWPTYGLPVALSAGVFATVNFFYLNTSVGDALHRFLAYPFAAYLIAGSGVALFLLYWALRAGRIDGGTLGLELSGWTPWRRLAGLAVILLVSYGQCVLLQSKLAGRADHPTTTQLWADYCLWFVLLLPASLAELLVFLGMGFCFLGRGLRNCGVRWMPATVLAAAVASVGFGLFHYTYDERFHSYAFPLMGEMLFVVLFFLLTRNFYLALGLHNAFAAVGFLREDHLNTPFPRTDFDYFSILTAFAVPFLLLHAIEWWAAHRKPGFQPIPQRSLLDRLGIRSRIGPVSPRAD